MRAPTTMSEPSNQREPGRESELKLTTTVKHASDGLRQAARDAIAEGRLSAGFFRVQLARGSVWSPCRIWRGFGWENGTHHFRESMWTWRALLNGVQVPVERVWPGCAWYPITRGEYFYRLALFRHAVRYEPHLPEASPYQKVDFETMRFSFAKE